MEPKEIERTLVRLYILFDAAKEPIDGSGITEKLRERRLTTSLGSVRRILRELETKGYLVSHEVRNSRSHRMYAATPAGRLRIKDAKKKIRALIGIFGRPELFPLE